MRFLVDVCVGQAISRWLADGGHDVLSVADRNQRMSDSAILEWSVSDDRILITLDKDFPELAYKVGEAHRGIVRLPNVNRRLRLEMLASVLAKYEKQLLEGAIVTVTGVS